MLIQSIVKNGIWLISLGLFASLSFSEESKDAVSGYHPDLTASEDSEQRSPDEYSDGLTLSSGPSLFEGREQLSLADEHTFSSLLIDRLEYSNGREENYASYKALAWVGKDYQKYGLNLKVNIKIHYRIQKTKFFMGMLHLHTGTSFLEQDMIHINLEAIKDGLPLAYKD